MTKAIAENSLATRYAKAFLNVFWQKLQPLNFEALKQAELFFKEHKQACFLMRLSLLSSSVKYKALKEVRVKCGLSAPFDEIIKLLIDHKRSSLLQAVFAAIIHEAHSRLNTANFVVSFVGDLTDAQKKKIVLFLEQSTGKTVTCVYQEDTKLIAGLRLQSDQFLWEASIGNRLNRVRCLLKR